MYPSIERPQPLMMHPPLLPPPIPPLIPPQIPLPPLPSHAGGPGGPNYIPPPTVQVETPTQCKGRRVKFSV